MTYNTESRIHPRQATFKNGKVVTQKMMYGWETLGKDPRYVAFKEPRQIIKGELHDTGRTVKPEGFSKRHIFEDEAGQKWVIVQGAWWRFPQEIDY